MKRTIITLVLAIICFSLTATEPLIFRALSVAISTREDGEKWGGWGDWDSCNLLIICNIDKDVISIDNNYEDLFHIRFVDNERNGLYDENGEVYSSYDYSCYDKEGRTCNIRIVVFEESLDTLFYIYYKRFRYVYSCKIAGALI